MHLCPYVICVHCIFHYQWTFALSFARFFCFFFLFKSVCVLQFVVAIFAYFLSHNRNRCHRVKEIVYEYFDLFLCEVLEVHGITTETGSLLNT